MGLLSLLQTDPVAFVITALALMMALAFHEFAHAWTADRFGDPTPRSQGRVTLNPLKHLDPFGTLLLLLAGFGFAKPVMVNMSRLGRWQNFWVAAAGPLSNILLAVLAGLVLRFLPPELFFGANLQELTTLGQVLLVFFSLNVGLAVFNLLPIPMLDGSRILSGLVPPLGRALMEFERSPLSFVAVMGFILLFQGQLGQFLSRVREWALGLVFAF
ncbi:peptidase M50 [Deinococcus proteolyticus MRP]|uniref:Peptidase M50 n=1 Tax=Deinococcus proteolyticus (strain ATCC 35074 / DSM 20540 / JCM 6276 / NBRC 101906 / NCIMB 13154 / VKM Ac-1939 / CCM 2703 / MRP) TaxID=693977 RepID=F0RK51_DEIPM|nr:site-2 protease family protein [Deinococcus proteolyticus]ADY25610.1 peptidase M50 [Deinococcus proteolyticus MRP]